MSDKVNALVDPDDFPAPRQVSNPSFTSIFTRRVNRRKFIVSASAIACMALQIRANASQESAPLSFNEVPHGLDEHLHLSEDYSSQVVLRWGDPLFSGAKFNPQKQNATSQLKQFGFNNDFVAYIPISKSEKSSTCLLYTSPSPRDATLSRMPSSA